MRRVDIEVEGGAVPTVVLGPEDAGAVPAVVVVPSVFGPATDLIERLSTLADRALVCVPDPFWRTGEGPTAYGDMEQVKVRFAGLDRSASRADMAAVAAWARAQGNGRVIGVGICFGGPIVLLLAAEGVLDGVVTWHGSGMERVLHRAAEIRGPVRHHLGSIDPITPPEVVDALREAFADHPDAEVIVHEGADHGFTHDGGSWDPVAHQAALDAVVDLLDPST